MCPGGRRTQPSLIVFASNTKTEISLGDALLSALSDLPLLTESREMLVHHPVIRLPLTLTALRVLEDECRGRKAYSFPATYIMTYFIDFYSFGGVNLLNVKKY